MGGRLSAASGGLFFANKCPSSRSKITKAAFFMFLAGWGRGGGVRTDLVNKQMEVYTVGGEASGRRWRDIKTDLREIC